MTTHSHRHDDHADNDRARPGRTGCAHGHDHDHGDSHSHGFGHHHHVHAPAQFGAAFAIGITLNTAYVAAEALWGVWIHSLSLLADAGHNLSDVLGLAAAWLAQILARRAPSVRFTYGMKRLTILTALGNATILLLVTGGIIWESLLRLWDHQPVPGHTVSLVALIGVVVNGATALLFLRGAAHDLNIRGAFLHMASDALMALGVAFAGLLITWTGQSIIDPIVSLIVSALIILGTWSLLSGAVALSLDAVPAGIDPAAVERALRALPGVQDLHHLHIWPMSTTETALTVHLMRDESPSIHSDKMIADANAMLQERFGIVHPTLQIETAPSSCAEEASCHGRLRS